jgi:hypothetical protein
MWTPRRRLWILRHRDNRPTHLANVTADTLYRMCSVVSHSMNNHGADAKNSVSLPVVFYGFEIWCLISRDELRRFRTKWGGQYLEKRQEVSGDWRKLREERLHYWCCSLNFVMGCFTRDPNAKWAHMCDLTLLCFMYKEMHQAIRCRELYSCLAVNMAKSSRWYTPHAT